MSDIRRVTVPWVRDQKSKRKLTMLTAYDAPMATRLDEAGIDMLLVGDSVGMVVYGQSDTLTMTMEGMLPHVKAVSQSAKRALVIGDLPFMSYQPSIELAILNAGRMMQEGRAQAVKLEGGIEMAATVRAIAQIGIPVVGHIGLRPQSVHQLGGYKRQGKTADQRAQILEDAKALTEAGAFALVLECVEESLARDISQLISIPTIGIGSGTDCDGQVLVTQDLLGLSLGAVPGFVNPLLQLDGPIRDAIRSYIARTVDPKMENQVEQRSAQAATH